MDEEMGEVCEKECMFEESLEIDFEYEFDVAKYYDFSKVESVEQVEESERWFHLAQGHPPSPLLLKLGLGIEELGESESCSPKYAHSMTDDVSEISRDQPKKGPVLSSKSSNQSYLSKTSRLLQPTASHLAKQNLYIGVRETKPSGRVLKLENSLKSPGDVAATKRQKLEHGYLRKVALLKHQPGFSHKLPNKTASSDVNCHTRPKVTVPKELSLHTANRALRYRSKNAAEVTQDSKYDSCSVKSRPSTAKSFQISEPKLKRTQSLATEVEGTRVQSSKGVTQKGKLLNTRSKSFNATMHKESDQMQKLRPRPLMKTTNNKKLLQAPLSELFSKMSLKSENQLSSVVEDKLSLQKKGLKKKVRSSMKENRNATTTTGKTTRRCRRQSQISGGRMKVTGNQQTWC